MRVLMKNFTCFVKVLRVQTEVEGDRADLEERVYGDTDKIPPRAERQ